MLKKFSSRDGCPTRELFCNNVKISARVADTPEHRLQGLMGVKKLGDNEGCLLDFRFAQPVSLWMRNVPIDLDVAFLDAAGTIVAVDNMLSESNIIYKSPENVRYALEMSKGFLSKHKIEEGDIILL